MARFPALNGFDELTIANLQYMIDDINIKATNTTRASTVTPTDDTDFAMPLEANATYIVEYWVRYAAVTAELIRTAWSVPSVGWSGFKQVFGPASNSTQTAGDILSMRDGSHVFATNVVYGSRASNVNASWLLEWSIITTDSTAGNVCFQWAQSVTGTTGAVVLAGSYGRTRRWA